MLEFLLSLAVLGQPTQAAAASGGANLAPEQLAAGAIREIISAQAVHKKTFPETGYACRLEQLVQAQLLLDVWLAGKRVEGYAFKLWCESAGTPQTTYRASAVPLKKERGSMLTVCADETNVPRTVDGTVAACFEQGAPAR